MLLYLVVLKIKDKGCLVWQWYSVHVSHVHSRLFIFLTEMCHWSVELKTSWELYQISPNVSFFLSVCILDDLLLPVKLIKVRKASHHIGKNLCYKSDSYVVVQFNPIFLASNFIFLYFKLIIIYHHTQKQRKIKFKPRTKLTHNIYKVYISIEISVDPPTSTPFPPS